MKKYIQKCLKYNKSLKIDKDALFELDKLYKEIGMTVEYSVKTENNINYYFENLDELLEYDFSDEIKTLKLTTQNYTEKLNLDIVFNVNYNSLCTVYGTIAEISYLTTDEDIDIVLDKKINEFYKKHKTYNWIFGKIGFNLFFLLIFICLIFFITAKDLINNTEISVFFLFGIIIGMLSGVMTYPFMVKLNTIICKKFFKPIVYYIGKQKEKVDKMEKIKSNIFWSVVVGLIVGIATTIICRAFEL